MLNLIDELGNSKQGLDIFGHNHIIQDIRIKIEQYPLEESVGINILL